MRATMLAGMVLMAGMAATALPACAASCRAGQGTFLAGALSPGEVQVSVLDRVGMAPVAAEGDGDPNAAAIEQAAVIVQPRIVPGAGFPFAAVASVGSNAFRVDGSAVSVRDGLKLIGLSFDLPRRAAPEGQPLYAVFAAIEVDGDCISEGTRIVDDRAPRMTAAAVAGLEAGIHAVTMWVGLMRIDATAALPTFVRLIANPVGGGLERRT